MGETMLHWTARRRIPAERARPMARRTSRSEVVYDKPSDIDLLQERLDAEPYFRCGAPPCKRPSWVDQRVTLEVPIGELAASNLGEVVAMKRGFGSIDVSTGPLTGSERFNAQGLEGKASIVTTLFDAFIMVRDWGTPHRWRILCGNP